MHASYTSSGAQNPLSASKATEPTSPSPQSVAVSIHPTTMSLALPVTTVTVVPEVFTASRQVRDDVANLREWLNKQLHLPSVDDQRLASFLNSCNYSLEATKNCIDSYFTCKTNSPEFFSGRDILAEDLQQVSKVMQVVSLTKKSPEGFMYVMTRLINTDPTVYNPNAAIKLGFMVIDAVMRHTPFAPGIIAIQDMRGVQFSHIAKVDLVTMRKQILYVEEAMPVKLKSIHAINVAPVVYSIFNFVKPLISKEHLNMIHFHAGDTGISGLDEFVPTSILPKDYGGDDLSMDELFERTLEQLVSYRDWFQEDEAHCKVDESKRQGKMKKGSDVFGQQGSFKKLNFD